MAVRLCRPLNAASQKAALTMAWQSSKVAPPPTAMLWTLASRTDVICCACRGRWGGKRRRPGGSKEALVFALPPPSPSCPHPLLAPPTCTGATPPAGWRMTTSTPGCRLRPAMAALPVSPLVAPRTTRRRWLACCPCFCRRATRSAKRRPRSCSGREEGRHACVTNARSLPGASPRLPSPEGAHLQRVILERARRAVKQLEHPEAQCCSPGLAG